ncbi:PAS/PAC sensor signal transduction histidine kinase [Natronolimnohabitans innermongolicus JCM 12255]|uniref:histidine kinase n=2 Tax=Natronolimnohabitans innermongolicus TaxID=253107 RepID=L9WT28_9EURY|nr:PAS/PAC sensor signal transduction histidine kinase [Natronolimnohabitans innermongolicus JCM 12255]
MDDAEALERYRTLTNAIDGVPYQVDGDGRFAAVGDGFAELAGYSGAELAGEHVSQLLATPAVERLERTSDERRPDERDDSFALETTLETAAGDHVPIELRGSPLIGGDDGDDVRGIVGIVRERSEQQGQQDQQGERSEQQERQHEHRQEQATDRRDERHPERSERRNRERTTSDSPLDTSGAVTTILDEADVVDDSFDVAWIDETAQRYFGLERAAVVGRDKRTLVEETIRDRVADGDAFAETVLSTYDDDGAVERFECRVTADDGREERWLEHRSRPIESGRYAGGRVELYYDVTDRRRRAAQLQRVNEAVNDWLEESSLEAVAEQASGHLEDILEMEINGVYFHDSTADELRPVRWTDRAETLFGEPPTFRAGEGIAWRVFDTGEPEVYADVTDAPGVYDAETPIRSEIVLPIGEYGVVIVGSTERNAFDDDDLTLAKVVASSLEATLDRIHQDRRLERERDLTDRILDVTPVGTLVVDSEGEVTRMNERITELFRIEDRESYTPTDRPMYDEDGTRLSAADYPAAAVLETGEPVYDRILQVELPGGERRWLSVNAVPITDEDGTIDRVVTTGEDVTDLKRRERELETELSEVFGRVDDGVYALDEEYRLSFINDRAAELLDVDERTIRGARLDDAFGETPEIERVQNAVDEAMDTQEPTHLEHYSELLECWVEATVYPSETGTSVYFRDVTERKEIERELRERERQLSTLMDNVPGMVYRAKNERGWPMEFVSDGAAALTGYDTAAIEGGDVSYGEDVVHDADRDDLWNRIQRDVADGESFSVTYRIETADGDRRWVREYGRPVFENDDVVALEGVAIDITERKEIERQLEESEAKFRTLAENVDEIVWMSTPDSSELLYVNPVYEEIWGRDRESLYDDPHSFLEDVHPDDSERVRKAYAALPDDEYDEEFRVVRPDGSVRWVHAQAVPVREGGDVVRIVGVAADVTERRERERELREINSQLEAAIDAGAVGTWEWHVPEDRFVAGEAFARTFGVDPAAAKSGVSLEAFVSSIHEDDRERVEREIDAALEAGNEYEAEYRVWDDAGDLRWVLARGHVECDAAGNPITFPGTLVDITDRKRAELELERQTRELETLFEVLPVGTVVANGDGSIRRANGVAKRIWGDDVFDVEGVDEYERFTATWADSGEPVSPEEWTMAEVLRGEAVTEPNVYEIEAFDGERRIIMEHGMPVRDAHGNVSRAIVTLTDITERREYQRRLEDLIDDLEESNERLEQFAYAASHDLQEPLRMVSTYLRLLERRYEDELDDDGREFLQFAVDGADRMRNMIDGLLAYSRIETRGNPFEPTDLEAVFDDVHDDLQFKIRETDATITADPLPCVNGDPNQLRQVFQNLLDNALEYSGDQPPRIHVSADRRGDEWEISVHDDGIGIAPDDADQIFEIFHRLHSHDAYDGAGIGLAVCERIVERHGVRASEAGSCPADSRNESVGGEIWVDSEPGEGSTFSFTLPAVSEETLEE